MEKTPEKEKVGIFVAISIVAALIALSVGNNPSLVAAGMVAGAILLAVIIANALEGDTKKAIALTKVAARIILATSITSIIAWAAGIALGAAGIAFVVVTTLASGLVFIAITATVVWVAMATRKSG